MILRSCANLNLVSPLASFDFVSMVFQSQIAFFMILRDSFRDMIASLKSCSLCSRGFSERFFWDCDLGSYDGVVERLYKRGEVFSFLRHLTSQFFSSLVLNSFQFTISVFSWRVDWLRRFTMSQSGLVSNVQIPRRKIKISHFDNSALIAGYSKTLIGRCMNPQRQDMKTLLFMLPRI